MLVSKDFFGFVSRVEDALFLIEAAQRGHINMRMKRLTFSERMDIKSGSTFIYNESKSLIKRWTDGGRWSSSRLSDGFFIYHQHQSSLLKQHSSSNLQLNSNSSTLSSGTEEKDSTRRHKYSNYTSLNHYFNKTNLCRRAISVIDPYTNNVIHLVNYYTKKDLSDKKLQFLQPDQFPNAFEMLEASKRYITRQMLQNDVHTVNEGKNIVYMNLGISQAYQKSCRTSHSDQPEVDLPELNPILFKEKMSLNGIKRSVSLPHICHVNNNEFNINDTILPSFFKFSNTDYFKTPKSQNLKTEEDRRQLKAIENFLQL